MGANHVLRILRNDTDDKDDYVLVNAHRDERDSQIIILEGTEGELAYFAKFTHSQLSSFREPKSTISQEDWLPVILYTLLPKFHPLSSAVAGPIPVTFSASISSSSLQLHAQHVYSDDIVKRLGDISLPSSEDHEINFLHWTSSAVLRGAELAKERDMREEERKRLEGIVVKLQQQLEELIQEKAEGERKLLASSMELLNAKKAKVRALMRMMQGGGERVLVKTEGKIKQEEEDPDRGNLMSADKREKGKTKERQAGRSRLGKRKQSIGSEAVLPNEINESESESGFEDIATVETPDRSDVETDDGGEEDELVPAPKRKLGTLGGKLHDRKPKNETKQTLTAEKMSQAIGDSPPPRRELPFGKDKGTPIIRATTAQKDIEMEDAGGDGGVEPLDQDQETSDDEL